MSEQITRLGSGVQDAWSAGRAIDGASFALDAPRHVPALWGRGDEILWSQGEPLFLNGPPGVGKSTLVQNLALALIGVCEPEVLGLPVARRQRVLYIAADRPQQLRRSLRRMVSEHDRPLLAERLVCWQGPLPFDLVSVAQQLATWAQSFSADVVVIDSLKDVAPDLADGKVGAAVNRALQHTVACGIDVVVLHHQRKGQDGNRKPRKLDDVYGSAWLTAGAGSVVVLWGEPGDAVVEFIHLKQPAEEVGPLKVLHDQAGGRMVPFEQTSVASLLHETAGVTVKEVAIRLFATASPEANLVEKTRRKLDRLVREGAARKEPGGLQEPDRFYRTVTPREAKREELTEGLTGLTNAEKFGSRTPHAGSHAAHSAAATPLRGAEPVSVSSIAGTFGEAELEAIAARWTDQEGGVR